MPYLTVLDVIAMHDELIERTGGAVGLRDEGALDSAIMRPQMAAYYEEADLVTQAVLLMSGIALAHAFVDGNKRTALASGDTFLQINDQLYEGDDIELARQIEALVTRPDSLEDATARFVAWLRPRLRLL